MCLCACSYTHGSAFAHVYIRARGQPQVYPTGTLSFEMGSFPSLEFAQEVKLAGQKMPKITLVCLRSIGIIQAPVATPVFFFSLVFWKIELKYSFLQDKDLTITI